MSKVSEIETNLKTRPVKQKADFYALENVIFNCFSTLSKA